MLAYLITAAGVATAATAGYQSMSPTGQWYGSTFTGLPRGSKQLALTYDDGPNDPHTLRLLEVLAKHDVRATFFMMGRHVRQRPDIARELANCGHEIGNHTFTHPRLTFKGRDETRAELQSCKDALTDAVGTHSNLFRPPFGGRRPGTLRVAHSMGLVPVMWNITGYDWKAPSVEYIERRVCPHICGGNVVLLHDGGHLQMGTDRSRTVIATDRLIARYKSEGYEFVTIPQMLGKAAVRSQLSALR